jgi:hypothetical protein
VVNEQRSFVLSMMKKCLIGNEKENKILDELDKSDGVSILVDDDDKHRSVGMN